MPELDEESQIHKRAVALRSKSDVLEELIQRTIRIFKLTWPVLHRFFTSKVYEYKIQKAMFGFPFGAAVALFLHFFLFSRIRNFVAVALMLSFIYFILFSVGYGFYRPLRCIIILILPIMGGKEGRSFLSTMILADLASKPLITIGSNSRQLVNMASCNRRFMWNLTKERVGHQFWPAKQVLNHMWDGVMFLWRYVDHALGYLADLLYQVDFGSNPEKQKALKPKFEDVDKFVEKSIKTDEQADSYFANKMQDHCDKATTVKKKVCTETWELVGSECTRRLPSVLKFISPFTCKLLPGFKYLCPKPKLPIMCTSNRVIPGKFGQLLRNCWYYLKKILAMMAITIVKKFSYYKNVIVFKFMSGEVEKKVLEVKEGVEMTTKIISLVSDVVQLISSILFFRIVIGASRYQRKYLTDNRFENVYLTRYFKVIDARRRLQKRMCLLPLKKEERKGLKELFSLKLDKTEKLEAVLNLCKIVPILVILIIAYYFDSFIYALLKAVVDNSSVTIKTDGIHSLEAYIEGEGFMAFAMRKIFSLFTGTRAISSEYNTADCLTEPLKPDAGVYLKAGLKVMFMAVTAIINSYTLRLRRAVCTFFYPKREKERILWLYNYLLRRRNKWLNKRMHTIVEEHQQKRLNAKGSVEKFLISACPFFKKLFKPKCVVCGRRNKLNQARCKSETCVLIYCDECWSDIKFTCYVCASVDIKNVHSDDGSAGAFGNNE